MIAIHPLSVLLLAAGISARSLSYDTKTADFSKYAGLYQSSFDKNNNRLFVTNSVGRPPVNQSDLLEVDPESLSVTKDVQPAFGDSPGKNGTTIHQRYAVYGISTDEKNDRVWVTNTRQNTVAFYNGNDLSLGVQYPQSIQDHPRDVYVDQNTGLAYVSASTSDVVDVFDASKTDNYTRRVNLTESLGKPFSGVMSLVADEANKVLYTVSLKSPIAAAIDLNDYSVKSYDLGDDVKSASGVAWDSKREHLFVANQASNNTVVLDPKSGKVVKSISLPGGPLNARYDPVYDVVYVACRTGHSVAVIDAEDYSIITQLNVTTPNQIEVTPEGVVYVTDKSPKSLFYKFTPKNQTSGAGNATTSGSAHSSAAGGNGGAARGSGAASASGSAVASGSGKGSAPAVGNAASILQAPLAVGAIAAVALLI